MHDQEGKTHKGPADTAPLTPREARARPNTTGAPRPLIELAQMLAEVLAKRWLDQLDSGARASDHRNSSSEPMAGHRLPPAA